MQNMKADKFGMLRDYGHVFGLGDMSNGEIAHGAPIQSLYGDQGA